MTRDESNSAFEFGLVCEGAADERTVTRMVRRVLEQQFDWLWEPYDGLVSWRGVRDTQNFTKWSGDEGIKGLAREHDIRVHGGFQGLDEGRGEARQATKAIRLFRHVQNEERADDRLAAVFLIRDTDGVEARRPAVERAREESSAEFEIVIGVPHTKRECWVLVTFEPESDDESEALDEMRSELGFDPTTDAHRLTATSPGAKKNAIRVLDALTGGDTDREDRAIDDMRVAELEHAGEDVSLAKFIREIRDRIPRALDPPDRDDD